MTRFRSLGAAAALAALLAGGVSYAQAPDAAGQGRRGPGGRPGMGREAGLPLRELNLTAEQRTQIRTLMQQHQERLRNDIFALLTAEQQAKVQQLEAERQARRQQRQEQRQQRPQQ
jgi:Spy/CpxP family protein refolding chaperone